MESKIVSLIIRITKLKGEIKSISDDLDNISKWLKDPEIISLFAERGLNIITKEDYE